MTKRTFDSDEEMTAYLSWVENGRSDQYKGWQNVPLLRLRNLDAGDQSVFAPLPPLGKQTGAEALVTERGKTHGDWMRQAVIAQELKRVIADWDTAGIKPQQREALEMIAVKMSRILSGNPNEPDHWDDIAGYAVLGKQGHKPAEPEYKTTIRKNSP